MIQKLIALILISGNSIFAQSLNEQSDYIYQGLKNSVKDPEWIVAAGVVAASTMLDSKVQTCHGKLMPKTASHVFDIYGQGVNHLMANGYIYVNALASGDYSDFGYMKTVFYATSVNAVLTAGVKYMVRRTRPNGQSNLSFPSGHTSGSFTIAACLHELYGPQVGVPAYIFATLTGLQRIHDNKHWLSDVLAGALLGMLIGRGFAQIEEKQQNKTISIGYRVSF
ncbi:phosphatase PAP2 family protein [candidate division KSB1 bacterium]|nr:phosphatase PAP2 family protein [candidate division KSB1 bacterium]